MPTSSDSFVFEEGQKPVPENDIVERFNATIDSANQARLAIDVFTYPHPNLTVEELAPISAALPDFEYLNVLNYALRTDNVIYFESLLSRYPEILSDTFLIFRAARFGAVSIITHLHELHVDLNAECGFGLSVVHYAAYKGNMDIISKLNELGVDLNAKDSAGLTAANYARCYGHEKVLAKLEELGVYYINNIRALDLHRRIGFVESIFNSDLRKRIDRIAGPNRHDGFIALADKMAADTRVSERQIHPLSALAVTALTLGSVGLCLGALGAAIALIAMTQAFMVPVVACTAVMTVGVIGLASAGFFARHIKQSEEAAGLLLCHS